MTHASWNNERGRPSGPGHDNERLEYLGDAVLELVVGEYLFRRFPEYDEGQLTQLRAALVNTLTLARLAERLHLGEALYVGKGAAKTGARQLPSLLANSFEAMIGAIFLDQGYRVATRVFLQNIGDLAEWTDENFKGKLQEAAQERTGTTPSYRVTAGGGPGHKREYTAEAIVGGEMVGTGRGGTKQAAEQAAARAALDTLSRQPKRRPARAAGTTPVRAARAARDAERATAGEQPRVRRRVAEVAADRSVTGRRRERDTVPPLLAERPAEAADGPQKRRRGLLGAIRSAAEALVGRVVPVEPEVPAAPPSPAPRQRARGAAQPSDSGRNVAASRRGNGAPAGFSGAGAAKPGGGRDRPATSRRSRPPARAQSESPSARPQNQSPSAGPQNQNPPAGAASIGGRRTQSGGGTPSPRGQQPPTPPPAEGEEPRRSSRRGRRGGRGRRRPGTTPETPAS
jgi:ribonuclease-3